MITATKPASVVRILGIDPGLRLTGFGVIEKIGEKVSYIASGTIKTASAKTEDREELPARLKIILDGLDRKSTRLNSSHVKRSRMPSSA